MDIVEDLDEEYAEVQYVKIKKELLPLMFIKGASIQSLTNKLQGGRCL